MKRHRWRLKNGLTVLYQQNESLPLAAGTLLVPAGSVHDFDARAGLGCLSAGLLFQGSKRWSARQIAEKIESRGASLGGHASEDYTDIGFVGPSAHLDTMLDVVLDSLANPRFDSKEVSKERDVLLAAVRSRHDAVFNHAYDSLLEALYGNHPYGRPIEGREADLSATSRGDLKQWHGDRVRPDGSVFSLIGPWSVKSAQTQLKKWERWKGKRLPAPSFTIPAIQHQSIEKTAAFEQAYLMRGTTAPSFNDPSYLSMKLLNAIVGGGMSSRLFSILRERHGLAYEVSSFLPARANGSHWVMYLGLPEDKVPLARKLLDAIIDDLHKNGPTAQELADAKRMIRGAFLMEQQTRRRQAWYAAWWEFTGRGPDYGASYLKNINAVTLRDVKGVAKRLLSQPAVWVHVHPQSK